MAFHKDTPDGDAVSVADMASPVTAAPSYIVQSDVFETVDLPGATDRKGSVLKYTAGQEISGDEYNRLVQSEADASAADENTPADTPEDVQPDNLPDSAPPEQSNKDASPSDVPDATVEETPSEDSSK